MAFTPVVPADPGFCSPARTGSGSGGACLTKEELADVARAYNKAHAANKIPERCFRSHSSLRQALLQRVAGNNNPQCKKEFCVLNLDVVRSDPQLHAKLHKNFRPQMPASWLSNDRQWLSTFDIERVMSQYEHAKPSFSFAGVFPVDFSARKATGGNTCVSQKLCSVPGFIADLQASGKSEFGMVFNLDRHDQPGSHWVALYCGMDPRRACYGIFFYDSLGQEPPHSIKEFMKQVKGVVQQRSSSAAGLPRRFHKKFNSTRFQYQHTECGVYSMLFIIMCMYYGDKTKFRELFTHMQQDDWAHQHRWLLYRPPPHHPAAA